MLLVMWRGMCWLVLAGTLGWACDDDAAGISTGDACSECAASGADGSTPRTDASDPPRDAPLDASPDAYTRPAPPDGGDVFVPDVDAGPGAQPCERLTTVNALGPIAWRVSVASGTKDDRGQTMNSTEVRSFDVMHGKLFAAQGIWMDPDDAVADQPGPQILVLDRSEAAGGKWRVDFELSERVNRPMSTEHMTHRYITFSTMRTLRFERDAEGKPLDAPVSFLVAGVWDRFAQMNVFVRDVAGDWTTVPIELGPKPLALTGCHHHVRSFAMHRDAMTGADLVFAGTNAQDASCPTRIYRGAYDRAQKRVVWDVTPEPWEDPPAIEDRVTTMAEANGRLYATACGKVFERTDGSDARWSRIYTHPDDNCPAGPGENGFRGATPIPSPEGQRLLMAMEGWQAHIGVLQLRPTVAWHNEVDTNDRLQAWLGTPIGYSIVAYDGMLRFRLPGCEAITLMGLEANTPGAPDAWNGWAPRARYFVRYDDGAYENRRLHDDSLASQPPLVAVRTMIASPFDEDEGLVIYAGGFDANHVTSDDTGWLYRGTLARP